MIFLSGQITAKRVAFIVFILFLAGGCSSENLSKENKVETSEREKEVKKKTVPEADEIKVPKKGLSKLHEAVKEENLEKIKKLIKSGVKINTRDSYGVTPLHMAATNGQERAVKVLFDYGADPNIVYKGHTPVTPLHQAAYSGHFKGVKILLKNGAKINFSPENGMPPIFPAVIGGDKKMVIYFIKQGAKLDVVDPEGRTPLDYARHSNHKKIVDLLRKHLNQR